MRLLRADGDDLMLENINDESDGEKEPYAILSHRWLAEHEEVTYIDIANGTSLDLLRCKRGWRKLQWCRQQALNDGYRYIWADTACIDKSSSQELTESINSMYRWYEDAECCYVYLHDMPDQEYFIQDTENQSLSSKLQKWDQANFQNCVWFTRAWTLQEMIAPRTVRFYSQSWTLIGDLGGMAPQVSRITGVHSELLTKQRSLASYSIAQKMSWAAGRSATKIEDRAYSLLGIMDVAMGVVYGEREHAFQRLQDELLRSSSDDSIFAFNTTTKETDVQGNRATSLLADSPDDFHNCSNIALASWREERAQYQTMSKEVNFRMRVLGKTSRHKMLEWILSRFMKHTIFMQTVKNSSPEVAEIRRRQALLQCYAEENPAELMILNLFALPERPDVFYVDANGPRITKVSIYDMQSKPCPYKQFSVLKTPDEITRPVIAQNNIIFCQCKIKGAIMEPLDPSPSEVWLADATAFIIPKVSDTSTTVELQISDTLGPIAVMSVSRASNLYISIGFDTKNVDLPNWTTDALRLLGQKSYHSALTRRQGRLFIARAFRTGKLLEHLAVSFVVVEEVGVVGLIYFAGTRVLLLTSTVLVDIIWFASTILFMLYLLVEALVILLIILLRLPF